MLICIVHQAKSHALPWGGSSAGPAQSVADSSFTRKSPYEASEQIVEPQQHFKNASTGIHGPNSEWQQRAGSQRNASSNGFPNNHAMGNWQRPENNIFRGGDNDVSGMAAKQYNGGPINTSGGSQPGGWHYHNQHQQDQNRFSNNLHHIHGTGWGDDIDKPEDNLLQHDDSGWNHDGSQVRGSNNKNTNEHHNLNFEYPKTPPNWNAQDNGKQIHANFPNDGANTYTTGLGGTQSNRQHVGANILENGVDTHTGSKGGPQKDRITSIAYGQAGKYSNAYTRRTYETSTVL